MSCCHYYAPHEGGDYAFSIDASSITFGAGCLAEAGDQARALGLKRVALFTDIALGALEPVRIVRDSLRDAGVDCAIYDEVRIEPTDLSFLAAARFASDGHFDGYVSVGGGSVMDTCKAANLYATYPADFLTYVNAPIGEGRAVPGPLKPHIACPTTTGTGAECTGIAVFDLLERKAKTGIASRRLRPTLALIDPNCTRSLPATVVAASGFDVLSHALESYTALPYTRRARPERASLRPMSQGANPWSDTGCMEALRLVGANLERAVRDADDFEARSRMMYGATLAGIAFGNAGVHVPHGMSYAVGRLARDFCPHGYPQGAPLVPHGMSVIVNAPAVFRFTASACPERHFEAAQALGAETRGANADDSGEILAEHLIKLMRATDMPNGIGGVGYRQTDVGALSEGTFLQQRLLRNAPRDISRDDLKNLFSGAMAYW